MGGSSDAVEERFLRIRPVGPIAKILPFLPIIAKKQGVSGQFSKKKTSPELR